MMMMMEPYGMGMAWPYTAQHMVIIAVYILRCRDDCVRMFFSFFLLSFLFFMIEQPHMAARIYAPWLLALCIYLMDFFFKKKKTPNFVSS